MDHWLKEALFHRGEHRVLGMALKPLAARHLVTLEALGNGYVGRGETTLDDFLIAALVCGSGTERELQDIVAAAPWAKGKLEEWGAHCGMLQAGELEREVAAFGAYWEDFFQCAELMEGGAGSGGGAGAGAVSQKTRWECHWVLIVVGALVRGGYPEERAWWMPIGEALAMKLALLELDGARFEIWDERQKAEMRELGWEE